MKSFLYRSLIVGIASPVIVVGHAMIATGTAITTGGFITKEFGENKAVGWVTKSSQAQQKAIENKRAAEVRKDQAKARRHQLRVQRLEAELQREEEAFRASGVTMEAQLA
jgi:hypothetical protein